MAEAVSSPERVVLSHDLSAFLVELSIALHKYAMYPSDHPSLEPTAYSLTERAECLLDGGRPALSFGVARHQLIIDGVATDPNQPVLRRLAETLHQHRLGAVSILPGVECGEVHGVLQTLASEHDLPDGPPGSTVSEQLPEWPHVRLHPITLDRLELIDDDASEVEPSDKHVAGRAAQLWVGLASAAMALDPGNGTEVAAAEPVEVAKAIDEHDGALGYDQVIVGYLLQIADELKSETGGDLGALRRRIARLVGALKPQTLKRLVAMGGNAAQRRAFVLGATSGMAVDSVLKIVQAAADVSGQTISHGLVRMLSKLSVHAEFGDEHVRPMADTALREQVDRLLSDWTLADPNPDEYRRTLQHLATNVIPEDSRSDRSGTGDETEDLRIVQMSLEVGGIGPLVDRAINRAIEAGHIRSLRWLCVSMPEACGEAGAKLLGKLTTPDTIETLLSREPVDFESLDALLPSLTLDGHAVLLEALATSESRTTRRKLLDRLIDTEMDITPLIVARLGDERWYVLRNLLLLLERRRSVPPGFSAARWTEHSDARVRYQAIALQLSIPDERDTTLQATLKDPDERVVRLGLLSCQQACPGSLAPVVANLTVNPRASDELRVHAVRALGGTREPIALDALLRLVEGGKTLFGRPKLFPRTPIVIAALQVLADVWPTDRQASAVLTAARGSSDPEFRRAAGAKKA